MIPCSVPDLVPSVVPAVVPDDSATPAPPVDPGTCTVTLTLSSDPGGGCRFVAWPGTAYEQATEWDYQWVPETSYVLSGVRAGTFSVQYWVEVGSPEISDTHEFTLADTESGSFQFTV